MYAKRTHLQLETLLNVLVRTNEGHQSDNQAPARPALTPREPMAGYRPRRPPMILSVFSVRATNSSQ